MSNSVPSSTFLSRLLRRACRTGLSCSLLFGIAGPVWAAGEEVRGALNHWENPPDWRMSASLGGTFIFNSSSIKRCRRCTEPLQAL